MKTEEINPDRKWSPQEILNIPEPRDPREISQKNSRSATSAAVAEAKIRRNRIRKAKILRFLQTHENVTIPQVIRHFKPETIGIKPVWGYLKVLEQEGRASCSGNIWNPAKQSTHHE